MFFFNRAILFKAITLLSLCGIVWWMFLEEHVTNSRIHNHLITLDFNKKNIESSISTSTNENTPLSSEDLNTLLKEGLENFDFVSTETEDNGEESDEETKEKEELMGKTSIQKMINFEEGRIQQQIRKKKPNPTPYEQLVQNPIDSRRAGADRGSRKGTIDKGGLLPDLEGASKNIKELSLYLGVAGKEFTPQLVMKPALSGGFPYFIQNEYEALIRKSLTVDSYWRAAVHTMSPLSDIQPLLPKIVVIGVMKAGTTTLHSLLGQHPQIITPTMSTYFSKEAHFYDRPEGYRYPESYVALWAGHSAEDNIFKCKEEATPSYLYFPLAPFRMNTLYENKPKLIVVLRDPVSRAYSHCHHAWGDVCSPAVFDGFVNEALRQIEKFEKSFDKSMSDDPIAHFILKNCKPEILNSLLDREARMFHDKFTLDHKFWAPEILLRGMYANQLKRWFKVFPREHFHIMEVADLEKDTLQKTMNQLYSWLDLDSWEANYVKSNAGGDYSTISPMWEGTKRKLTNFFTRYDDELEKLLGRKFSWMK